MKFSTSIKLLLIAASVAAGPAGAAENLVWKDIRDIGVEGRGWNDTATYFERLPERAGQTLRPALCELARQPAGMLLHFKSDAARIHCEWALTNPKLGMAHMTPAGVSGVDLYVKDPKQQWRWIGVGLPKEQTNSVELAANIPAGEHEYLLYLPTYNGVQFARIGIPAGAKLERVESWGRGERKPILFYGTSICQGGCATRPGMNHVAILGRKFDWPVINLGFSGNAKMEIELAGLLAELDPSVFVIDPLPNMSAREVAERTEPFVRKLREMHPKTPIVLVEDRTDANAFFFAEKQRGHDHKRAEYKRAFDQLRKSGVKNLYYVRGDALLGDDSEATVDGSHPTDLGFMRQAEVLAKALKPLLKP